MAYEKQTWENGDVITADKLNHIEDGVSNKTGKIEIYNIDGGIAMRASYNDLQRIISNGSLPFIVYVNDEHGENTIYYLSAYDASDGLYSAQFRSMNGTYYFTASDAESEMVHTEK